MQGLPQNTELEEPGRSNLATKANPSSILVGSGDFFNGPQIGRTLIPLRFCGEAGDGSAETRNWLML
jgi:hypothetical protein